VQKVELEVLETWEVMEELVVRLVVQVELEAHQESEVKQMQEDLLD
jgi:hypothetical protein